MKRMKRKSPMPLLQTGHLAALLALMAAAAHSEEDYGNRLGRYEDGRVVYYSSGTALRMEAIDPSVKKWYLPQEVAGEYRSQWEYTNYAKNPYRWYLNPSNEGDYFYDLYGRFLNKGWLVYDWRQTQPTTSEGSGILQSGQYSGSFSNLVISTDTKGQHHLSVSIGDEIRTSLTPMTFRKTAFNGVQFDYMADRFAATVLMSRINLPVLGGGQPAFVSNYTNLIGLRAVWDIADKLQVGGTFVNAHHGRIAADRFQTNPFTGNLTSGQLDGRVNRITVRITDDSPEDLQGGPVLFSNDIEITTRVGDRDTVIVGSEIGFLPLKMGGIERNGFRVAEGRGEEGVILLEYIFSDQDPAVTDLESIIPDLSLVNNIRKVRFLLLLSNDYKVEVTSNRQTDNDPRGGVPQFTPVARAAGNVQDNSNRQLVVFDYGLPTATQVVGFTLESKDIAGFEFYSEFNINHHFTQYPHRDGERDTYTTSSGLQDNRAALGWMINLSRSFQPFYFFGEAFGMDAEYNTSPRFVDGQGQINYADTDVARSRHTYDFVDDNDDNDRKNDQKRRFDDGRVGDEIVSGASAFEGYADEAVFPGLDENNDFVPDFNQNDLTVRPNLLPDYEEPFLRYNVDRPEYLFALDLNNNGWGDRFENDDEPDYVYKRDRRGFNTYIGTWIVPEAKITVGYERVRQPSTGDRNRTTYALMGYQRSYPALGVATFYNSLKLVEDNIVDDLIQWVQRRPVLGTPSDSPGSMQNIRDPLGMPNTLVNKTYLGFERLYSSGLNTESKLLYEIVRQLDKGTLDRDGQQLERTTRRFGLINKFQYLHRLGRISLTPRFKHELFMDDTPFHIDRYLVNATAERKDWTGILSLLVKIPFMKRSAFQLGLERLTFRDFVQDEKLIGLDRPSGLNPGDTTGDYNETSVGLQLSNISPYLGYDLMLQMGLRIDRRKLERFEEKDGSSTSALSFISVQAGLE